MGAEEEMPSIGKPRQRVKVYRLNEEGKWDDWGTGHVTVDYLERSEELGLFVIDEEDNETLLAHHIRSDEIYRRQDDTIISWRDPEYSTELALSFQETAGCSCIWEQICGVERNLDLDTHDIDTSPCSATEVPEASVSSQANGETFKNAKSELREFPAVSLSTLPLILKTVVECGIADQMRVIELIFHNQDFFQKLIELFRTFEDSQEVHGLRLISKFVKGIILLNSPLIFEKIFGDELIMDIIGSLEYDPEVPHVQHHRAFLKEHVVFKEAIPIGNPLVLSKIHQTYRVGYIKDVILPRELDEATVANLNSIIDANNAIVVSLLKDDNTFIQELFARMRSSTTSPDSKRNLVLFLHEFCSLSKSLQLGQQLRFFRDLMNEGMFDIITDALRSPDKRLVLTGTDILNLFMNKDPNFLRSYVIRLEGDPLFGLLVQGMTTDFGEDMHYQFLEILRSLLDSHTLSGPQRDTIIEIFYEKHLDQLIDVITSSCPSKGSDRSIGKSAVSGGGNKYLAATKPEILSNICELLCFCVYHHPCRIKCNLLLNNVIEKVLFLTRRREKYLVVAAIRFVRGIISHSDEQVLRYIVKNDLLKPVVESFVCNGNRYNLLNSAVLELFEYIRKQNLKILVKYLVDSFWNQLVGFDYLPSIQTLKLKYEQYQENYETNTIELVSHRKRVDDRALEKEEEEYFNEDSDDEDTASACTSDTHRQQTQLVLPNGEASSRVSFCSGSGGLVDYDDDDDEDYNPPCRSDPDTSTQEERTENCLESKQQLTSREEFPLLKKPRLDKKFKDCVFSVVCSASNRASSVDKKTITRTHSATHTLDEVTVHETHSEKEPASPTKCSNCLTDRSDTRELNREEHSLIPAGNSSPSEIAINSSNIAGSEPYSVR